VRAGLGDGTSLTDATLELLSTVLERLPPTPSRFHYVFNLRDLSRLYEGLLRATPQRWGRRALGGGAAG
jgi:dynein heavy chain